MNAQPTNLWFPLVIATLAGVSCTANVDDPATATESAVSVTRSGLRALALDEHDTSVSGLSSGGFMAVQFHVAFSSSMRGVAVFAGGPYDCAEGSLSNALTRCMSNTTKLDISSSIARTRANAASGAVDPIDGLRAQNVYLFGGALDHTVEPTVMDALADYYRALAPEGRVVYESRRAATAHTFPTRDYGSACDRTSAPFVGRCGFDGAGAALAAIYGTLAPAAKTLGGRFVEVKQTPPQGSAAAHSLADVGYAYVPKTCEDGASCRVHVAFHGCAQSVSKVGDAFYKHAGYNEWADTNGIVMLYPQTIAGSGNSNGCWDWYGYDSADYAKKSGPQMATVRRMIDALARGDSGSSLDAGANDATSALACVLATNVEHVAAGRAYVSFGLARAKGTHVALGVYSTFVSSALVRIDEGTYRPVARCP